VETESCRENKRAVKETEGCRGGRAPRGCQKAVKGTEGCSGAEGVEGK
jgi:hypothetical protein